MSAFYDTSPTSSPTRAPELQPDSPVMNVGAATPYAYCGDGSLQQTPRAYEYLGTHEAAAAEAERTLTRLVSCLS